MDFIKTALFESYAVVYLLDQPHYGKPHPPISDTGPQTRLGQLYCMLVHNMAYTFMLAYYLQDNVSSTTI